MQADKQDDRYIQQQCLQSLRQSTVYAQQIYTEAGTDDEGNAVGYFKAKDAGRSTEDGVRTNADMAMVCAFVWLHDRSETVLRDKALKALRYATATHHANKRMKCTDGKYWGSINDHWQWESSLWAYSVALAAKFLGEEQSEPVKRVLEAEADNALQRPVLTGFEGDTKAEENGWDTNVLAVAAAFYPRHPHAGQWLEKMKRLAFNCYSVSADSGNALYEGANLFLDFTLQNHNYFHTSYQNAGIQELAESMLASPRQFLKTKELVHHWQEVWDEVLVQLALADGELAMPNGNDWSMFLYDQLPAYAAMATILRNADALMLENMALKYTEARQQTTPDGAWMLNSDIGPRRMGVTAHRVMMTYLMHDLYPVGDMAPTVWADFQRRQAATKWLKSQNIVRSMSKDRFVCFSWSEGLKNANCLIVPNLPDKNKIIVPYKRGVGGNIIGHPAGFRLDGKPVIEVKKDTWKASGQLRKGPSVMHFTITDCWTLERAISYYSEHDQDGERHTALFVIKNRLASDDCDKFVDWLRQNHPSKMHHWLSHKRFVWMSE